MKSTFALACLLSALAVPSFAQYTPPQSPAEMGAKLVAERDAAWRRTHAGNTEVQEPMAIHDARQVNHGKHMKNAKHVKRVKHAKHIKHVKRIKHVKHLKHVKNMKHHVAKPAPSNVSPANPQ